MTLSFLCILSHSGFVRLLSETVDSGENLDFFILLIKNDVPVYHPVGSEQIPVESLNSQTNLSVSFVPQQKILLRTPGNVLVCNFYYNRLKNFFDVLQNVVPALQMET